MKRVLMMCLMLCAGMLTGCAALPAEERSFAVALAISGREGAWTMHARIPTYQSGGEYATVSGSGQTPGHALAALDGAAPMPLHLGQLRLLVIAEDTATSADFPPLMAWIAQQETIRMGAAVAVTRSDPAALMEALKPSAGTRLSKSLDVLLDTRIEQGTILPAALADVLRMDERQQAVLMNVALDGEGVSLAGCWPLCEEGRAAALLSPEDTQLLSLMMGHMKRGALALDGGVIRLTAASAEVSLDAPTLRSASASLTVDVRPSSLTPEAVRQSLATSCLGLLTRLSAMGCDALGLGRQAAAHAPTAAEWREIDWPARYRELDWSVTAGVRESAR